MVLTFLLGGNASPEEEEERREILLGSRSATSRQAGVVQGFWRCVGCVFPGLACDASSGLLAKPFFARTCKNNPAAIAIAYAPHGSASNSDSG